MLVAGGSTDVKTYFAMRKTSDGTAATGLTPADFDMQYVRSGVAPVAKVDATALAATDSAHADNKIIEIDATDQPGLYRADWPDAAFAAGVREAILTLKVATAFTEHLRVEIDGEVTAEALGTQAKADVNAEADQALTDYAGPTKAEMDARTLVAAAYFDPAADAVANVTLVDTTTANTDMVGTDGALTDKAGFSLSTAGILAIWHQALAAIVTASSIGKLLKDEITSVRMAVLTDWIDAGRLDLLLDAIPTTAMRGTDNGALASVCSETRLSELDAATPGKAANQIDEIRTDTGVIGVAGAGLTDLGGMSAVMKAQVNAEGDQALTDSGIEADLDNATDGLTALKAAIDAIPTTAMRGTDGANTATPLTAAQVNAEVVDALSVDTYAEPGQGTPAATASIVTKIGHLYKQWRNKSDNDGTTIQLYNDDALTVDQKRAVSEAAGTVTKNEVATGP